MQTLKSKIKNLMILGVAAAEAADHHGVAETIKQEAESAMADIDAMSSNNKPTRHALRAVSDSGRARPWP